MTLGEMKVGRKYLAGDNYGYDWVECLENPASEPEYSPGVNVKIKYIETGEEEIWYEHPCFIGQAVSIIAQM